MTITKPNNSFKTEKIHKESKYAGKILFYSQ